MALITVLLVALSLYSYGSFARYKPKDLIPLQEVRGAKTEEEKIKLPYPGDYKIIGTSIKEGTDQVTYETTKTAEEIQTFYRNILISQSWQIDSTGNAGIFTTTKYKKDNSSVDITTSLQTNDEQAEEEITIVSVLIKS